MRLPGAFAGLVVLLAVAAEPTVCSDSDEIPPSHHRQRHRHPRRRRRPRQQGAAGHRSRRPQDFVIAEDGVAQKVDTFTPRVARRRHRRQRRVANCRTTRFGDAGDSQCCRRTAAPTTPRTRTARRIVFGQLSRESLRLAQRATLDYVPMTGESSVRVGVFAHEPGMQRAAALHDRPRRRAAAPSRG